MLFFAKNKAKNFTKPGIVLNETILSGDPLGIRYSYNEKAKIWQFLGAAKKYCCGSPGEKPYPVWPNKNRFFIFHVALEIVL